MVVGSANAVAIISVYIDREWSIYMLLFPPFAYGRAAILIFSEGGGAGIPPGSELARTLWVNALNGTVRRRL